MISIVLAAFLILSTVGNSCAPKFLLPSTIHDSVKIYSFTTSNAATKAVFAYTYLQSLFSSPPQAMLSISEMISSQIKELNYQLSAELTPNNLNLNFASKNMVWNSLQVQFILHARTDIASRVETISISEIGSSKTYSFPIQTADPNTNSKSYVFKYFIIGIVAVPSSQYAITLQPISVSSGQFSIVASSNVQTSLTVQTIYFDPLQNTFSYSVKQFSFMGSQQPQYRTLWTDFAPTIYTLFGFSMMKQSGSTLSITANLDEAGSIFTISNMNGFSSFRMSYLAFGVLPQTVCSPCNSFIAIYGCLDVCPNNSYPQNLKTGGKTCRYCNTTLGLALNAQNNACTCPNGQSYFEGNCHAPSDMQTACGQNQLSINNDKCVSILGKAQCSLENQLYDSSSSSCRCAVNYERIQGQCVQSCPVNSKRDSNSGICVCSAGYLLNGLNACVSICPSNSYFDTTTNICFCNPNYQMINGVCNQCGQNTAYDAASRSCVAKFVGKVGTAGAVVTVVCQPNEIIENGICQCNQNSIKLGTRCTPCPPATHKPAESNQCFPCSSYCSVCQSNTQCLECNKGFQITNQACDEVCGDGMKFILPCDDGNTVNGDGCSSSCQIESGFACNGGSATRPDTCSKLNANTKISISISPNSPTYVSTGIITEFIVNPPIRRSRQELHHMFSLTFSNNKARPMHMRLSQGDDLTSVRCFFSYNGNLPNQIFTVNFKVHDETYGDGSITIMYNSLLNPVKAAIAYMGGASSDELK